MSDHELNAESLAALLDGTASAAEREAVLRTIAASQSAYAQFIEASAIRRELRVDDDDADAADVRGPDDLAARRRRFLRFLGPLAILAAALVVAVVSRQSRVANVSVLQIAQTTRVAGAEGSGSLQRTLGANWNDAAWSVTRGSTATRENAPLAFRAGVRFAQLEIAENAADTAAVRVVVKELEPLLASVSGSGPIAERLEIMATSFAKRTAKQREAFARQVRALFSATDWFDLGVWVGAAQVAARNEQLPFFDANNAPLSRLSALLTRTVSPSVEWKRATQPLGVLTQSARPVDVSALPGVLERLASVMRSAGE